MVSSINSSGISVGSDGKLSVSGFSSGIDWKSIIDAQIKAQRAPAASMEAKISTNNKLISAYGDLKTKVSSIVTSLDALRGAPGSSVDVFQTKTASGSTSAGPSAAVGYTPSSIDSLVLLSVSNSAQAANHTLVVKQLAQAQQVRSGSFTSTTTKLTDLGVTAGTISIGGKNIVVGANDSLLDLKNSINASGGGVTASIVSANATTNYLVLTSSATGLANQITFGGSGATLDSIGITSGGGTTVAHELKPAADAIIDVDGITDIHRSTNSVDDVVNGVTFSLLKAEPDTEINLKIEPDLSAIKTAIGSFVDAYNALRKFVTDQRTPTDLNNDGTVDDSEVGPLATNSTMRTALDRLTAMIATNLEDNTDGYQSLGQIGVVMQQDYTLKIDDSIIDNKLLTNSDAVRNLFALNVTSSDSRITALSRTDATKAGTYYLNIGGTDGSGNITSANIRATAGSGSGGASDGSVTATGKSLKVATGDATGLGLFFNGDPSLGAVDDIRVTVSRGLADQYYDFFNNMTKATTGTLDTLVTDVQNQDKAYTDRIEVIDSRLEVTRSSLTAKFVAMETALAKLQSVKDSVTNYFSALNKSSS